MGKITSIFEKYKNMGIDKNVIDDYIKILNEYVEDTKNGDIELSNEDFLNLRNKLKAKKS